MFAGMMAVLISFTTCACGGNSASEINTLSGSFSADSDSIWYYMDEDAGLGKDGEVESAYVFKDGILKRYEVDGSYTLGDFAKMSDEEIITSLDELYAEHVAEIQPVFEQEKEVCEQLFEEGMLEDFDIDFSPGDYTEIVRRYLVMTGREAEAYDFDFDIYQFLEDNGLEELMSRSCKNMSVVKEAMEGYLDQLNNCDLSETNIADCELAVYTDSTGNNTESEIIACKYIKPEKADIARSYFDEYPRILPLVEDYSKEYPEFENEEMKEYFGVYGVARYVVNDFEADFSEAASAYDRIEIAGPISTAEGSIQVYDSYYGGYYCGSDGGSYGYLITRTADKVVFALDEVGAEGVEIDPESIGVEELKNAPSEEDLGF